MPLTIHSRKISPDGSHIAGEEAPSILDIGENQGIRAQEPVKYDFFVQVVSRELVVKGSVNTQLSLECVRCGAFFSTYIEDSSFLRAYEISEEVETVDLTEDIREAVLLKVPNFPLCSSQCKGVCLQCGQDLNAGTCACEPPHWENRWGALDQLDSK